MWVTLIGFIVNLDILFHDLGQKVLESNIFKMQYTFTVAYMRVTLCWNTCHCLSKIHCCLSAYRVILSSSSVWKVGSLDSGLETSCSDWDVWHCSSVSLRHVLGWSLVFSFIIRTNSEFKSIAALCGKYRSLCY